MLKRLTAIFRILFNPVSTARKMAGNYGQMTKNILSLSGEKRVGSFTNSGTKFRISSVDCIVF